MKSILRAMYSPLSFDVLFALLAVICATFLVDWSGADIPPIAPAPSPLTKGASLAAVGIVGALLGTASTRFDQAWADDYVFQTLCKSALVGIMGFVFAAVIWGVLLADALGRISSLSSLALLLAVWSVSYFIVRLRGTGA
jgi:hypothetical protein